MKAVKILMLLLLSGSAYAQTVTPNPGPYQGQSTKYQWNWSKWTGGIWNLGKMIQTDSAQFSGVTYVRNAPDSDSSTEAANTGWVKRNITSSCSIRGGVVTWSAGLTFDITRAAYCILGTAYSYPGGTVALSASDPTNPRIDVIGLDNTGNDFVLTGTPAADPAVPQIDPSTQIYLTHVYVAAGATTPTGVTSTTLWDENTGAPEWTAGATGLTVDFNNTTNVYHLTKSADVGSFTNGDIISFAGTGYDLDNYNTIKFFIKLKAALNNNQNIAIALGSVATPQTNYLTLNATHGFDKSSTSYQVVSIALADLNYLIDADATGLLFRTQGSNTGFYLDWITLNGGTNTGVSSYLTNVFASNDSLYKVRNGLPEFWYKVTAGGGSGTVTSFSSGNFSPLFTTGVATSTTTPALSFSMSDAPTNTFLGRLGAGSGIYSFINIGLLDSTNNSLWHTEGWYQAQNALYIPRAGTASDGGGPVTGPITHKNGDEYVYFINNSDNEIGSIIPGVDGVVFRSTTTDYTKSTDYGQGRIFLNGDDNNALIIEAGGTAPAGVKGYVDYSANYDDLTYIQRIYAQRLADSIRGEIADSVAGTIQSVVAGTNVTVDNTDPRNPVVSASGDFVPYTGATQHTDLGDYNLTANELEAGTVKVKSIVSSTVQYSLGNSITAGQGATTPTTGGYAYLLADDYGLTISNNALSGSGIWNSAKVFNAGVNPGHTNLTTVMAGLNDVRRGGASRGTLNKIIWGLNSIIANQYLKSYVTAGAGSGVTRHGTWTTNYSAATVGGKSGALGAYTNIVNDSIVYTFTDSTVVVGLVTADGVTNEYADFTVYIDNVSQGTFTENFQTDGVSDGVYDNKRTPMALIFKGLTNATHKIKLVNNSAPTSKYLVVDYFGHLIDSLIAQPLLVFHAPRLNATGYATSPALANDIVIDTLNSKIDSLVANYSHIYPIKIAQTNSYYNIATGLSGDNIHPNDVGHSQIRDAGIAALPPIADSYSDNKSGAVVAGVGTESRPFLSFYRPSNITNQKVWDYFADTNHVAFRVVNDDNTLGVNWLKATRSAMSTTDVSFTSNTLQMFHVNSDPVFKINNTNSAAFLTQNPAYAILATNRSPVTGTYTNTGAASNQIVLNSSSGNGAIDFYTTNTNNAAPSLNTKISVNGVTTTQYRLSALNAAPSSASDTGTTGEIRVTATHFYVCTATNTWVRAALATW